MRTSGNLQESNVNIQIFGERSCWINICENVLDKILKF